jgi:hypothetical protein
MSEVIDTIICTVGTSLRGFMLRYHLTAWESLELDGDASDAVAALLGEALCSCGAEGASIASLLANRRLRTNAMVRLVGSSSPDSALIVQILSARLEHDGLQVSAEFVPGLMPGIGVSELDRCLAFFARFLAFELMAARDYGGNLALNVTGGLKSLVAYGVVCGSSFAIPTFQLAEGAAEPFEFARGDLPIDATIWRQAQSHFQNIAEGRGVDADIAQLDTRYVNGNALSASGALYHFACMLAQDEYRLRGAMR